MYLSPHFTLEEAIASQTAARRGIDNTPPPAVLAAMRVAAQHMENVRAHLCAIAGKEVPIILSSWYRCPALNAAVGGSASSSHMDGDACDFRAPAFGSPLVVARAIANLPPGESNGLPGVRFDQLIHEYGAWVHIGFGPRWRGELLTISHAGTRKGLHAIK